jgi:tetratricopeptide (TPR) repeat protein
MKKLAFIILYIIISPFCYGQEMPFDTLLNRAKAEFAKDFDAQDYGAAIKYLNSAIELNPKNAEAHYCLAYAYSRFNSSDATTIPSMKLKLVLKVTDELQQVISLSPKYAGPFLLLDPYSKLTSEWGSLAIGYQFMDEPDSTLWALNEGKKRGAFDDFILSINRAMLNSCSNNAILVASGDNYTIPLFYLQKAEHLRTDVTVVDIAMLNTVWYPKMLQKQYGIDFGLTEMMRDTLQYRAWADAAITIPTNTPGKGFTWVIKPSYQGYLLRGDRLFLALLKRNRFKRDVYFTKGFPTDDQLSLDMHLRAYPMVDKLNMNTSTQLGINEYVSELKKYTATFAGANKNANGELLPIDFIRSDLIGLFGKGELYNDPAKAKQLKEILRTYLPEDKYPCNSADICEFISSLDNE